MAGAYSFRLTPEAKPLSTSNLLSYLSKTHEGSMLLHLNRDLKKSWRPKRLSIQVIFAYKSNMSTEVLSVRIERELKREAEKLNIDIKKVVEKALAEAVEQAKRRKFEEAINALLLEMEKVSEDEWVRVIKESRRRR